MLMFGAICIQRPSAARCVLRTDGKDASGGGSAIDIDLARRHRGRIDAERATHCLFVAAFLRDKRLKGKESRADSGRNSTTMC